MHLVHINLGACGAIMFAVLPLPCRHKAAIAQLRADLQKGDAYVEEVSTYTALCLQCQHKKFLQTPCRQTG